MDTITTAVQVITVDSTRILHECRVDFINRNIPDVVKIVQYDDTLPIIAVGLYKAGIKYALPSGAACNVRIKKPDGYAVYNKALGCNSARDVVYIQVTRQIAAAYGEVNAMIEVVVGGKVAGSSPLRFKVDENPVSDSDVESSSEMGQLIDMVYDSEAWARGTIGGTPVSNESSQYHNNSKYYAEQGASSASDSASSASMSKSWAVGETGARSGENTNNSKYWAQQAYTLGHEQAVNSEAWAIGEREGVLVSNNDITYHNNSKYYKEQAEIFYRMTLESLQTVYAYIHLIRNTIGTVYLNTEDGDYITTENGNRIILDY